MCGFVNSGGGGDGVVVVVVVVICKEMQGLRQYL